MLDRLVKIQELCEILGISKATVYRKITQLPEFPKPIKISTATRFRESDVQTFIRGDAAAAKED